MPSGEIAEKPRDLSRPLLEEGVVPLRRTLFSSFFSFLFGWIGLVAVGVFGGFALAWRLQSADLVFVPMFSAYLAFCFWLYVPRGYRFADDRIEILRPLGIRSYSISKVKAVFETRAARPLIKALSERTSAAWLSTLPVTRDRPPGTRLLWLDPDVPLDVKSKGAAPLVLPLLGLVLLWGGFSGRFWNPKSGIERRYSRAFRPRLALWVEEG